jgi:hypothetical protein
MSSALAATCSGGWHGRRPDGGTLNLAACWRFPILISMFHLSKSLAFFVWREKNGSLAKKHT